MRSAVLLVLALAACAPLGPSLNPSPPSRGPGPAPERAPFELPLRLVGTEPFWGARIDGRTVELSGVDRPTVTARVVTAKFFENAGAYAAEAGSGPSLLAMSVSFDREPCSDGMSDRTYPWRATVIIAREPNGALERLHGCAIPDRLFGRTPG